MYLLYTWQDGNKAFSLVALKSKLIYDANIVKFNGNEKFCLHISFVKF